MAPSPADPHIPPHPNTTASSSSSSVTINPPKPFPSSPPPPLYTAKPLVPKTPNLPVQMSKIQEPHIPSLPPPQGVTFPIPSSNRGFTPKNVRSHSQPFDQMVTVANPAGFPPSARVVGIPHQARPYGFPVDQGVHAMRPPQVHQSQIVSRPVGGANSCPIKSVPVAVHPKATQLPTLSTASDYNHYKELSRETSRDDSVVMINNRKVRLSDSPSGSLYALCRSWVRNGVSQPSQPHLEGGLRTLPRPAPATMDEGNGPRKSASDEEDSEASEKEEFLDSVDHLSSRDLLEGHIKRAKRVRAQLREERLRRIDRYRHRLSLLLPRPLEQCRSDAATGS